MNFNKVAEEIYLDNKAKGFWDKERNVGEMLMLVTSELGEAMEAHRKGRLVDQKEVSEIRDNGLNYNTEAKLFADTIKDTFEDEIADSVIRLFDMAGGLGIDLDFHISNKLAYNKTRAKLHGKKY